MAMRCNDWSTPCSSLRHSHARRRAMTSTLDSISIVDGITDQFFALSRDWRFTYFNARAAAQMRILGKDPDRLIGQVLWDVFTHVPNETALRRTMTERVPVTDELFYEPLDEWVENHIYPS